MIAEAKRDEVYRAIEAAVGPSHVTTQPSLLARIGLRIEHGDAQAWLAEPGSAAEVSELVTIAARDGLAVVPVGNATRAIARPSATRERLYIDMRRMHHVLHLDETSLVVHVQAGLSALALENVLAPRGLSLGDYPPAALGSSIGGLLAVRTPGKISGRHGFIEDAVLGVSAVLADGRTIHTRVSPRRASGPDLARALCGSEGTLGIITSAVLCIHRRPESRLLAAFALPSFEDALRAVNLALREEAAPAAMRVCDADEASQWADTKDWAPGEAALLVVTAGPTDLAVCDRALVGSAVEASGGRTVSESMAEAWWNDRMGMVSRTDAQATPLPSLQVSATPSKQVDVYRAVQASVAATGVSVRCYASRFDIDGGLLFFSFVDPSGQGLSAADAASAVAAAETAAQGAGAFLLGQTNDKLAPYFEELRRQLDPGRILNPQALTS